MKPGLAIHFFDNAVGERKDKELLISLLGEYFYIEVVNELTKRKTFFGPPRRSDKKIKIDIGISCNVLDTWLDEERYKTNILLLNEEWVAACNKKVISSFDYVIVKSNYAKKKIEKYNKNIVVLPFWSLDRYDSNIKETESILHFAGKSIQKGTEYIIDIPNVNVHDATRRFYENSKLKCNYNRFYISDKDVNKMFNENNLHLCTSLYEGYGHYFYEALICGKKPIATHIPMWGEFFDDEFVTFLKTKKTNYHKDFKFFYKDPPDGGWLFREGFLFDKNELNEVIEKNKQTKFNPKIRNYVNDLFRKRKSSFLNFILDIAC